MLTLWLLPLAGKELDDGTEDMAVKLLPCG